VNKMRISKLLYGFLIITIFFGGLGITKVVDLWVVSKRVNGYSNLQLQIPLYSKAWGCEKD